MATEFAHTGVRINSIAPGVFPSGPSLPWTGRKNAPLTRLETARAQR